MEKFVGWNEDSNNRVFREYTTDVSLHKRAYVDYEGKIGKNYISKKPCG